MFCLWPANERHDLQVKIVPGNPRGTLRCSHDLSTTSPDYPLRPKASTWASHPRGMRAQSSREVVCSTSFLCSQSPPVLPPSSPQDALLGPPPPTTTASALVPLLSHFWLCQGQLPFNCSLSHMLLEAEAGDTTSSGTKISLLALPLFSYGAKRQLWG